MINLAVQRWQIAISRTKRKADSRPNSIVFLLILLLALLLSLSKLPLPMIASPVGTPRLIWTHKPVLTYFLLSPSLAVKIPGEVGLTAEQVRTIEQIALRENETLNTMMAETKPVVENPGLSLEQKREIIASLGYNERIREIIHSSRQALIYSLGPYAFTRLSRWIEHNWQLERLAHGRLSVQANPRTYRVFATRYDSGGSYTVALPDKCLKFANAGNSICNEDGYIPGYGYTVFVSYESGTAASVNESGPWNVDDNYWATSGDPTPRRMFADLALGVPEAQAAYFDGYNGGVDQFGRTVTAPFGIDLARQVSIDIGLEPGKNDWIDVSFMWTEGWDGSSASGSQNADGTHVAPQAAATIIPVELASPNPDGSVMHVVQEGQTLWNIAAAYQIDLSQILLLNGMIDGSLIVPGQKLLIVPANQTTTVDEPTQTSELPTHQSTATRTLEKPKATQVARLAATPQPSASPTAERIAQPSVTPAPIQNRSENRLWIGILSLGIFGGLIFAASQWLWRKP